MPLVDILATTTGGIRSALALLGVMVLIVTRHMPPPEDRASLYRSRTGTLFAASCVLYSPVHAAYLLDHPLPKIIVRSLDLVATSLGCAGLILLLASRAVQRGVPMFRVGAR